MHLHAFCMIFYAFLCISSRARHLLPCISCEASRARHLAPGISSAARHLVPGMLPGISCQATLAGHLVPGISCQASSAARHLVPGMLPGISRQATRAGHLVPGISRQASAAMHQGFHYETFGLVWSHEGLQNAQTPRGLSTGRAELAGAPPQWSASKDVRTDLA